MKKDKVILMGTVVKLGEALIFADNLTGRCDTCGRTVQYRPHAPKPFTLRCMDCAIPMIEPGDEMFTTQKMLEDAARYFESKKQ